MNIIELLSNNNSLLFKQVAILIFKLKMSSNDYIFLSVRQN